MFRKIPKKNKKLINLKLDMVWSVSVSSMFLEITQYLVANTQNTHKKQL
jgi:hypothetical protein